MAHACKGLANGSTHRAAAAAAAAGATGSSRLLPLLRRRQGKTATAAAAQQPTCLASVPSEYNSNVAVYDMPDSQALPPELRNSRVLLLDDSGNLHSVYRPDSPLTGAYWDCLALLPALVPDEGPIAILGLGAGSIAHLLAALYSSRAMQGWELDPAVVQVARQHMGLSELEQRGCLVVHTGDALLPSASVGPGGAAGIIVDLFADGQLIPQLTQAATWQSIRQRLAPGGRLMANLGAAISPAAGGPAGQQLPGAATTRAALAAMAEAFDGELTCCNLLHGPCANMIVVTGLPIAAQQWQLVPQELSLFAGMTWQPWGSNSLL